MARTATFNTAKAKVAALKSVLNGEGKAVSYYHRRQMVEAGLLKVETVQSGGRGRPQHKYVVAANGQRLLNASKGWEASAKRAAKSEA